MTGVVIDCSARCFFVLVHFGFWLVGINMIAEFTLNACLVLFWIGSQCLHFHLRPLGGGLIEVSPMLDIWVTKMWITFLFMKILTKFQRQLKVVKVIRILVTLISSMGKTLTPLTPRRNKKKISADFKFPVGLTFCKVLKKLKMVNGHF